MVEKLVIVESPSKAKTIQKYLGRGYKVLSSQGHVRDLPKSKFGIKMNGKFVPEFEILKGKEKIVKELKEKSKGREVLLASDNDREGEAIAWHLSYILNLDPSKRNRVVFNEITEHVIKEAVKNPRSININMVNSQLTRRMLDRIVGYKVSPVLWKIFKYGLSAGRVQSAALRILCEQEKKILRFQAEKYYEISAEILKEKTKLKSFNGKDLTKSPFKDQKEAKEALKYVSSSIFKIVDVKKSDLVVKAPLPFKTSTLQQAASSLLGFSVSRTMKIAQRLYEGVNVDGENIALITYMRTDSYRVSDVAREKAKEFIESTFGKEYVAKKRNVKNTSLTQDAHEAIRPTYVNITPESLNGKISKEESALYSLIWKRFVASQMKDALYTKMVVKISDELQKAIFELTFKERTFDGFEKVTPTKNETSTFPSVEIGDEVDVKNPELLELETKPPSRYTEASLVKKMESVGIGRPSTYATIIQTLITRKYVNKEKKSLVPTFLGMLVNDFLTKEFSKIVNLKFTASMEKALDGIEEGKSDWQKVLKEFNEDFEKNLERVLSEVKSGKHRFSIQTDVSCPKCETKMLLKYGRYGAYLECPKCGERKKVPSASTITYDGKIVHVDIKEAEILDEKCPKCGAPLVKRHGRYGDFISCSRYPKCDYIRSIDTYARGKCPKCGGKVIVRKSKKGKTFYICENNPKSCDFISWYEPSNFKCPNDGEQLYYKKKKNGVEVLFCQKCKKEYDISDFQKD